MKKVKEKLKKEISGIGNEVKQKVVGYILAALGLVAGLAWNDTIKALIEYLFPQDQNSIKAKAVYAVFITAIVVVISIYLSRIAAKDEKKKADEEAKRNADCKQ